MPSRPEFIDDLYRMQSTPMSVALATKSSISATNGTTTMLVPVSRITAGSMNNMLLPAPVGSTLIAAWSALSAMIDRMLSACLSDRQVAFGPSSLRSPSAISSSSFFFFFSSLISFVSFLFRAGSSS
ncbi:hypothetical protein FNYG_12854 [Fusarium nygamai]|uniref:Uncharacterized protein n=1 Tax=Gibberella nygamai TaxID=42673 RepID=A0A2K0VUU4_GIBNY|nr:hypothetical protein FNYG_12854 [Fusarium nygamai]